MENAHTSYTPPVDQLLTYGEGQNVAPDKWPNYPELGLGLKDVPELIRMAGDEELNWADSDSLEVWAPLHAWRALGQLRAEAAIDPLITLFTTLEESDWATDELPEVLGMIGPAALPALAASLADDIQNEHVCINAITSIQKVGERWPEARAASVELLTKQLKLFAENDEEVNAFLIMALVELHATEAAPLMERAFAAKSVDLFVMGDWQDVQVQLGLLPPEAVRQAERLLETPWQPVRVPQGADGSRQRAATQKKTKNKMAKQSRKKNRKR